MDELKKVLLAGIGLTSMTYDKATEFVKELIAKGRLTVDEGKQLQSDLKRKVNEKRLKVQRSNQMMYMLPSKILSD